MTPNSSKGERSVPTSSGGKVAGQADGGHRYEIWWVDRDKAPDVQFPGAHEFSNYHDAQQELFNIEAPHCGHFVIKHFVGNSPAGEIVHVDARGRGGGGH